MRVVGLVLRRLLTGAATLVVVTLVVFALVSASPGDPFGGADDAGLARLTPESRAALRAMYHLDEPPVRRYGRWIADVAVGDLGRSFRDRRPVATLIAEAAGTSLVLNALALAATILLAVPLGAAAAARPGSRLDRATGLAGSALYAVPVFLAALAAQWIVAVRLGWLPLYGPSADDAGTYGPLAALIDRAAHLVLPVACLSYGGIAYVARFVRGVLLDAGAADAALAARARGSSAAAALVRHGFRLAAVPMLTLAGFLIPGLVAGSVVVEHVFALPGLGQLFFEAAARRDMPVILGLTLLSGTATLAGIVVADVAYLVADPRTRRG